MSQSGSQEQSRRKRQLYPWSGARDLRHPVIRKVQDNRTVGERVADDIASFGGSWPFIFMFLGLIAAWMVLNAVFLARVLHHRQFDPYPFIALNLMLSALAGLQAPIIMMSQNRAATRDEALAGHHYEESQKMEQLLATSNALLQTNTDLTKAIHDLTVQIHRSVAPGRG
ncbi:MAG TPA: DUF1003 domain-containing protein [Actinomycetota bacterium]